MRFFGNDDTTSHNGVPTYPAIDEEERLETPEKTSRCQKYACWALLFFMAIGTISSLSVVLTGSPNPVDFFIPVDPPGMTEAIRWDATAGLQLTVENACDDTWERFVTESLADWEVTDALTVTRVDTRYDPNCDPINGRLRICNADYGRTNWKGLNVVFMRNDHIVNSVSKLNDYWLQDDDARLYTMCHELGHGWGLPHTDENHLNRDRGDCMDYTERPWNNLRPGTFNLDLMEQLYGTPQQPLVVAEAPRNTGLFSGNGGGGGGGSSRNDDEEKDNKDKEDDRRRGLLRRSMQDGDVPDPDDDAMFALYKLASKELEEQCESDTCVRDLGNNCTVRISKLLV